MTGARGPGRRPYVIVERGRVHSLATYRFERSAHTTAALAIAEARHYRRAWLGLVGARTIPFFWQVIDARDASIVDTIM